MTKKKMGSTVDTKLARELSLAQALSTIGAVTGGLLLAKSTGLLEAVPGMMILIPAFLGMRGNVSGTLASRLGTALHLDIIRPFKFCRNLFQNVLGAFGLSLVQALLNGTLALVLCWVLGLRSAGAVLILISLLAAIICTIPMITLVVFASFWLFRRGIDPDNVMGPVIATVGDLVAILALTLASKLILAILGGGVIAT